MNKNLLLALAFLFIGEGIASTNIYASDLDQGEFLGKVKSVTTTEYTPVFKDKKWIPGKKISSSARIYDLDGNMIEETLKGDKEQTLFITHIQPIANGKLVEYASFDDFGNLEFKESGRLGENDEILSMKTFDKNDQLESYVKSLFDGQGKVIKTSSLNDKGEVETTKSYGYNEFGKLSFIKIDQENAQDYVEFYNYDEKRNLVEVKTVTLDGTVLNQILNEYDDQGVKTKSTLYPSLKDSREHQITVFDKAGHTTISMYVDNNNTTVQKEIFSYSDSGKLVKSEVLEMVNDILVNSYTISYDEFGREMNRVTFDQKGIPASNIETLYKLDEQNNWIEKIERNNNKIISISKREIQYFL